MFANIFFYRLLVFDSNFIFIDMRRFDLDIYSYTDYRQFFRDYYNAAKQSNRHFSYRAFARRTGVSASVFRDIIAGRRRCTLSILEKYLTAMQLGQRQAEYLRALVAFANSDDFSEKCELFHAICRLRGRQTIALLDADQYEFFSNWFHSAIRELITLPGFSEDPEWIASVLQPRITAVQAKKSIELLLRLRLIRREDDGALKQTSAVVSSAQEVKTLALRKFHTEMIDLARGALERYPVEEREIGSLTLGVSEACYYRIKERIRSFREEILALVTDDRGSSETVCQLNFQLFPLLDKSVNRSRKEQ
jgi:uncharacterized protein (TIGR02147 family)